MHVLCLGAGRMGSQIGLEYALGGHDVVFVARSAALARERVEAALTTVAEHRLALEAAIAEARGRVTFRESIEGLEPVELVVESLPEIREAKVGPLLRAAAHWPDATIATNSSSISVSEVGRLAGVERRIVATHYWNPPILMPLVEMLAGPHTPKTTLVGVAATLRSLGKRPVLLHAEAPGLLWNRLQAAVLRECLWLIDHGVADAEQIDEVMRDGLARRWRLLGPFETVSLGGAPVFDAIAENLFPVLSNSSDGRFEDYVQSDPATLVGLAARRDHGLVAELRAEREGQ